MSNYCACSGGDEEYTIELNQQGPEGPKGDKGDTGFSPTISVLTSTNKEYILNIVNEENSFNTPNLYGEIEKLNADLSNVPNPAIINGVALSSIEDNISMITIDRSRITTNIDGKLILNATASNEESMEVSNYEVVVNPKDQRLELHDNEGTIKIVATTDQQANVEIATTTTAGIVKPDGSTITISADGTISAVGGTGDVTAAGNNTFTGTNTFQGNVSFTQSPTSSSTVGITSDVSMVLGSPTNTKLQQLFIARQTADKGGSFVAVGPTNNGRATFSLSRGTSVSASTTAVANFSYDEAGVYYKAASSNEINIIELITTMSNTISSLTDRISALETEINGGNA